MVSLPLLNLLQNKSLKLVRLPLSYLLKALGHVPRLHQFLLRDPLAHDQCLVSLGKSKTLDKTAGGAAFGYQPERREGGEQESGGDAINKVGEGYKGGGKTDDGPVQTDDQDLGVRVEGLGDVEVVGDEVAQPVVVDGVLGGEVVGLGDARVGFGD